MSVETYFYPLCRVRVFPRPSPTRSGAVVCIIVPTSPSSRHRRSVVPATASARRRRGGRAVLTPPGRETVSLAWMGVMSEIETYLYPLCTATTPNVMSLTVGDLKPAIANCESSSSCDGCLRIDSTK